MDSGIHKEGNPNPVKTNENIRIWTLGFAAAGTCISALKLNDIQSTVRSKHSNSPSTSPPISQKLIIVYTVLISSEEKGERTWQLQNPPKKIPSDITHKFASTHQYKLTQVSTKRNPNPVKTNENIRIWTLGPPLLLARDFNPSLFLFDRTKVSALENWYYRAWEEQTLQLPLG